MPTPGLATAVGKRRLGVQHSGAVKAALSLADQRMTPALCNVPAITVRSQSAS
jgi:hypothetical protein